MLLDAQWNKTVAACRSLGRAGLEVTLAGDTRVSAGFFSRYCRHRLLLPDPKERPQEFTSALAEVLRRDDYDVVIPMEDASVLACLELEDGCPGRFRLAVPGREGFAVARDKGSAIALAADLGIPCPGAAVVDKHEDVPPLKGRLAPPLVLKPALGSGSLDRLYAANWPEAEQGLRVLLSRHRKVVVQERIPAEGVALGISLLTDGEGNCVASFAHQRVREFPISGGASSCRVSIDDSELLPYAMTFLCKLRWRGVAMLEFKRDPRDGLPKLLEVNPRFWGSLPLALAAGVDFPLLLYKMEVGQPLPPKRPYRLGVVMAQALPNDLLACASLALRDRNPAAMVQPFRLGTRHDLLQVSDPLPLLGRFLSLARYFFDLGAWRRFIVRP